MNAGFVDAEDTPWLICTFGEVLVVVEVAVAGVT